MPNILDMSRIQTFIANLNPRKGFLLSFALGFVIRLIPELLSFPYPIGFDTIYYAAMIKRGVIWQSWTSAFSMWLFNAIVIPIHQITRLDPFILLKLVAPLLYALNVCGVYNFARKALDWNTKRSLLASLFFAFQLASLRLSWDLYRNMLSSALLLFALPFIKKIETKKGFILFVLLSVLVVFAHLFVSAVLLAVTLGAIIHSLIKREKGKAFRILLAGLPALVILIVSISLYPTHFSIPTNVIDAYEKPARPGGLFFLINYLGISDLVQNYSTYADLVLHVFSLFSVLYLWWLPLVLVGFFRNRILSSMTLMLLVGSFDALITPFCALDFWNRWMFMLIYPFTFYAVNGVSKVSRLEDKSFVLVFKRLCQIKISRRGMLGMFFLSVVLGSIFMAVPPFFDRFGIFFIPTTSSYLPSTMIYNSVPLRDVKSTIRAMEWLNENMTDGSGVLINHVFFWWANLYLDKRHVIIYFRKDVEHALSVALTEGFDPIYMIWWNEDYITWQNQSVGWYGITVPKCFKYIFSTDRVSVFRYSTINGAGQTCLSLV
jgi:hypothetical protein